MITTGFAVIAGRESPEYHHTLTEIKRSMNGRVPRNMALTHENVDDWAAKRKRRRVNTPNDPENSGDNLPPIRRPVLFYTTVTVAFSLLGLAILALLA